MATKTILLQILILISAFLPLSNSIDFDFPAVFNFGDSNSDTGGLVAGMGDRLDPPNGQTYFQKPSGRFCDGRLIIDFLMDAMGLPFLSPYLDSVGMPSFPEGCNFAAAGSTILPGASSIIPFSFQVQVAQFLRFKNRVLELLAQGEHETVFSKNFTDTMLWLHFVADREYEKCVPREDYFQKGLYMFDIGQNDLAYAFYSKSLDRILASVPTILAEFETGLKELYEQGARNFWIHNIGPLGCLPQNIARFGTHPSKLDELGCVSSHNQACMLFNLQLHALCRKLQAQFADAEVIYVDIFTIKSNLIANYSQYGFKKPLMACCGYGGAPLKYNHQVNCGKGRVLKGTSVTDKGCSDSSEYVNWDGIHYTEASNQYVSSQILTGKYSDPPF